MSKNIPITAAKDVAKKYNQRQVIIVGWDGERTHVTTYGRTLEECDQAARGGNKIKAALGWPESLNAEPKRVQNLLDRIAELEAEVAMFADRIQELKDTIPPAEPESYEVHVLEGTEYERGWGQRPDGFLVFEKKADADQFLITGNQHRPDTAVPDEFTIYEYIGTRKCSPKEFENFKTAPKFWIRNLKELTA